MNPQTVGQKSFALVCKKLEKDEETVSLEEMFVATRARELGRSYKDSDENTTSKIAEMETIETQQSADDSPTVDAFSIIMGRNHPGRLRLYGAGVTKTSLKRKAGNFEPTLKATNDVVQQMQERMQNLEEQKRTMRQQGAADVIAQLQRAVLINPNILAALSVLSPGEATSAPPAANHIIATIKVVKLRKAMKAVKNLEELSYVETLHMF